MIETALAYFGLWSFIMVLAHVVVIVVVICLHGVKRQYHNKAFDSHTRQNRLQNCINATTISVWEEWLFKITIFPSRYYEEKRHLDKLKERNQNTLKFVERTVT